MKQILTILFAFTGLLSFAQDKDFINDKNAVTRSIGSFSAIKVSGGIDLYLSQGETEALAVSASEEKYRDKIRTEVKNGTLEIWYDQDKLQDKLNLNSGNRKMKAYVSFKSINKLNASGASDVLVSGTINLNSLRLDLSGASDFKGKVKLTDLNIDMSGASDVNIEGSVSTLRIDASGASDLKGYNLSSDDAVVDVSGACDVNITVNKTLSAEASGASSISYKGNAVVKKMNSSGASSIRKNG